MAIVWEKRHIRSSPSLLRVLDKMVAWDLLKTFTAVLSVMVIIIISRKFIKILSLAIDGAISGETAMQIMGLKTITVIVNFLPAAIFMAILMVLGRMYKEQEMSAIASAGGGILTLYRAVFLLIVPLSFVASGLSLYAAPWSERQMTLLTSKDMETADLRGIAAGRFTEYSHGDLVFYTEEIDAHLRMHQIFIQDRQHGAPNIITAQLGLLKELPTGKYVMLEKGERSQGAAGSANFILETFAEYAVRIDTKTSPINYSLEATTTHTLFSSNILKEQVELHKRLAMPMGVLLLSLLAVPLAKLSPRGGVYGSLIFAFIIYFIYGNLSQINHSWMLHRTIPLWLGYLGLPILLISLTVVLLVRVYGLRWMMQLLNTGKRA